MSEIVDINVFCIAQTTANLSEVSAWMERIEAPFQSPFMRDISDPAYLIALAAKRCYMSFEVGLNPNVTKIRENFVEYFDNILKSGHGSVLEHASYTYAIEGVSRVFTAEMNRHHAGWAKSEGSMRYIRLDNLQYWVPLSIRGNPAGDEALEHRKAVTRAAFKLVFEQAERTTAMLVDLWGVDGQSFNRKKKLTSMFRRLIPMGVATGGTWTGNIRALRHVLAIRTDPAAEEEIAHVFGLIGRDIIEREPLLFQDFTEVDGVFTPKYPKV